LPVFRCVPARWESGVWTGSSKIALGYSLLLTLHILLLVYWLGADVAVFIASFMLRDQSKPVERRLALVPLLLLVDMFPRMTLIAMVPVGLALAWAGGWAPIPGWLVGITVPVAVVWLAAIMRQFRGSVPAIRNTDMVGRALLLLTAFGLAGSSLAGAGPFPVWLGVKVGLFGVILGAGLAIRLIPFSQALRELGKGSTPEREDAYGRVQRQALAPVLTIWGCLVLMTYISVAKP